MEKGDEFARRALEGFLVDEPDTCAGSLFELRFHIVAAKSNVMNAAGGILLQKFGDRAFGMGRLQEFQMHLADGKEGGAHLLRGDFFAVLAFQPQRFFVIRRTAIPKWSIFLIMWRTFVGGLRNGSGFRRQQRLRRAWHG